MWFNEAWNTKVLVDTDKKSQEKVEQPKIIPNDSIWKLSEEVEKQKVPSNYSELQDKFKENETMKNLLNIFWEYTEKRLNLDNTFNKEEKDIIKFAIFWEIQKELNLKNIIDSSMMSFLDPIKKIVESLKNNNNKQDIKTQLDNIKKEFEKLWVSQFTTKIDEKINQIKEQKNKNKKSKITRLEQVLKITHPKDPNFITKESINKDAIEISTKLQSRGNDIISEQIPAIASSLKEWLKEWLKSQDPIVRGILWIILWFFGIKLDDEKNKSEIVWSDPKTVSIRNLEKELSGDKIPSLKWKINQKDFIKAIKDENTFWNVFSYFDSDENNKIDYSKEWFWTEFLSWKSTNEKVKKLYDSIEWNKDWFNITKINEKDFQKEFFSKINEKSIELKTQETEKETPKIPDKTQDKTTQTQDKTTQTQDKTTQTQDKTQDKTTQTQDKTQDKTTQKPEQEAKPKAKPDFNKELIDSLVKVNTLPAIIKYQWKDMKLDIKEWKNIILWTDEYKISIIASIQLLSIDPIKKESFDKIEFKNWEFILNWKRDKPIKESQIIKLVNTLKSWKDYTDKWVDEGIPYTITVSKIK